MAEQTQLVFKHKEVVEALIKKQGLTEGIWGIYIKFGIAAANIENQGSAETHPAAIVPILEIGLQKFDKETNLSVDASLLSKGSDKKRVRKKA